MKTALSGSSGRSSPPRRYKSVLLPDPKAPTIETYAPRATVRLTPLRMCVRASPVPRDRWTFCARSNGGGRSPRTGVRGCERVSVGATDHLDRVVLRGAPRGVDRRDKRDDHRADERRDILVQVFA